MNIYCSNQMCEHTTANGEWTCATQSGNFKLVFVYSGHGTFYHGATLKQLLPGKIYFFMQGDHFRTASAEELELTVVSFCANFTFSTDTFLEYSFDDIMFMDFDSIRAVLDNSAKYYFFFEKLIEAIISYLDIRFSLPLVTNPVIIKTIDIICAESDTVTTAILAQRLNLDESHYIRVFKKAIGVTPMSFIWACRLSQGIIYLKNGMTVADAAAKCGYISPSAFTQAIKKTTGMLPSQIKQNCGNASLSLDSFKKKRQ